MSKFVKKPVTIEAVQWLGDNWLDMLQFAGGYFDDPREDTPTFADGKLVTAQVLDAIHNKWIPVRDGDWIIKGLKGEFYPCDPEVFSESYDPA